MCNPGEDGLRKEIVQVSLYVSSYDAHIHLCPDSNTEDTEPKDEGTVYNNATREVQVVVLLLTLSKSSSTSDRCSSTNVTEAAG
jgi:hypothetical protein